MKALKVSLLLVLLCVVIPFVAIAFIEGTASAGLLFNSVRARAIPGNVLYAEYDTLLGWTTIPNMARKEVFGPTSSVSTTAAGLRIQPAHNSPSGDEKGVLCSGGSFTFGAGVSDTDTFCAQLQTVSPAFKTVNLGQLGYSADQAYLLYKRDGGKTPHVLNLFAFNWTELERLTSSEFRGYSKPRLTLSNNTLVPANAPVPHWSGANRWTDASSVLDQVRLVQFIRRHTNSSDSDKATQNDSAILAVAEAMFVDLDNLNRSNGSQLVLVYLPGTSDLGSTGNDDRRAKLAALSANHQLKFVDLTAQMRSLPSDTLDWMFITPNTNPIAGSSGYYTRTGHTWVAQHVVDYLRTLGLAETETAVTKP